MADRKKELDIFKPIVKDLEGSRKRAQKEYDDEEERLKSLDSKRKWFGGGKEHSGFGGFGASDVTIKDTKERRDRKWNSLRSLDDAQEFKKGGAVRGMGCATRGAGRAMKGK